ncbi:MAG: GNAT family N-acetyltransferase [Emcibacteraceae bacterium]|nr:GNAT family N-acetyltransferase [Emcibacteraceae bacterium]MDG1859165.1 GNAT family N-acetyltransferase [Emcibacteraceae bacterium]
MNNYKIVKSSNEVIAKFKEEYLRSLEAPLDGMWLTFVGMSDQYEITLAEETLGYCSINGEQKILQFYTRRDHDKIYQQILKELDVKGAVVATHEFQHLSLALDHQSSVSVNAFLYQCDDKIELKDANFPENMIFRNVTIDELQTAVDFAVKAIGAPEGWLQGYYSERINGKELRGLWDGDQLIATGECRPSEEQKPYADLGMIVSHEFRGKGLATAILRETLNDCRARGLKPICSTESENIGARKAIISAGFTSQMRIVDVSF